MIRTKQTQMLKETYEIFIWVGQKQHSFGQQIFKRCQWTLAFGVSINRGALAKFYLLNTSGFKQNQWLFAGYQIHSYKHLKSVQKII